MGRSERIEFFGFVLPKTLLDRIISLGVNISLDSFVNRADVADQRPRSNNWPLYHLPLAPTSQRSGVEALTITPTS